MTEERIRVLEATAKWSEADIREVLRELREMNDLLESAVHELEPYDRHNELVEAMRAALGEKP